LVFLAAFSLHAQTTCERETVRLDSSGGSMERVQLIDQGDLGICYACVAAQAAASTHGVSGICPLAVAADLAAKSKKQMDGDDNALENDKVCSAVNAANKKGYCQNCGPLYAALRGIDGGDSFFDSLNTYFNSYRQTIRQGNSSSWNALINADAVSDFNSHMCSLATPDVRRNLVLPVRSVMLKAMKENNPGLLFQSLLERACTPRNPAANSTTPTCRNTEWPTRSQAQRLLRNHFSANTVTPLGMEYCSNVFDATSPESFISTQPDPSDSSLTPFRDYTDKSDKIKWLLKQFDRRFMTSLNDTVSRLDQESTDASLTDEVRARRRLTHDYIKEIRDCSQRYRTWLGSHSNQSAVKNMFFNGADAVDAPFSTIVAKVMTDTCSDSITQKRSAIAEGDTYSSAAREALTTSLQHQERLGSQERGCGGHASLIIGTRCQSGRFQYLVRNTWGQDCDGYQHDSSSHSQCEATTSSIWLDEDVIINNSYRYNTFN